MRRARGGIHSAHHCASLWCMQTSNARRVMGHRSIHGLAGQLIVLDPGGRSEHHLALPSLWEVFSQASCEEFPVLFPAHVAPPKNVSIGILSTRCAPRPASVGRSMGKCPIETDSNFAAAAAGATGAAAAAG